MTFEQIWESLQKKSPGLKDPTSIVSITSSQLERLLRQVYDQGCEVNKQSGSTIFDRILDGYRR